MVDFAPLRTILINKSLKVYQEPNPGGIVFDASQRLMEGLRSLGG